MTVRLHASLVPVMVIVVALLGTAMACDGDLQSFDQPAMAMVTGLPTNAPVSVQACPAVLRTPAPGAGKLRVREADRLGPARLYLPPPAV